MLNLLLATAFYIGAYWGLYSVSSACARRRKKRETRERGEEEAKRYQHPEIIDLCDQLTELRNLNALKEISHFYSRSRVLAFEPGPGCPRPTRSDNELEGMEVPAHDRKWIIPPGASIVVKGRLTVKCDVVVLGSLTCDNLHFVPIEEPDRTWRLPKVYASQLDGHGCWTNEELVAEIHREREEGGSATEEETEMGGPHTTVGHNGLDKAHISALSMERERETLDEYYTQQGYFSAEGRAAMMMKKNTRSTVTLVGHRRFRHNPFATDMTVGAAGAVGAVGAVGAGGNPTPPEKRVLSPIFDFQAFHSGGGDPVTLLPEEIDLLVERKERAIDLRGAAARDVALDTDSESEDSESENGGDDRGDDRGESEDED